MENNATRKLVFTSLMTALVFVLTFSVKIPVPYTSGYIHLGDSMIYLSVMLLGPGYAAFASGVGSMLADIAGGYIQYAIPTLIIKALMALIMGLFTTVKSRRAILPSVIVPISAWAVFCAGTLYYMNRQIKAFGIDNIVNIVVGQDADAETIASAAKTINNMPMYFSLGIAALIVILTLTVYLVFRKSGAKVFAPASVIGMSAAGICMIMGYFIVESIMYSPLAATLSIPSNMIQFFGGIIAACILSPAIVRARDSIK